MARNGEPAQHRLVTHDPANDLAAERAELFGRRLDVLFDLAQGEFVARALVPIGLAVDIGEFKPDLGGALREVVTLLA